MNSRRFKARAAYPIGKDRVRGLAALRDFVPPEDRLGSPPEVAVSALMSALADSGRAIGAAWVRVVSLPDSPAAINLLRLDARGADDLAPLFGLLGNELGEL